MNDSEEPESPPGLHHNHTVGSDSGRQSLVCRALKKMVVLLPLP